jgi:hypothetical protein
MLQDDAGEQIVKDGALYDRVGAVVDSRTNKATGAYLYQKTDKQVSAKHVVGLGKQLPEDIILPPRIVVGDAISVSSTENGVARTMLYEPICEWDILDTFVFFPDSE